jgi:hypothetical protein
MGLPLSVAASGPIDRAQSRAIGGLSSEARELVLLARCPHCRKRGSKAIRGWWVVYAVQTIFVVGIFVVPLTIMGGTQTLIFLPPIFAILGAYLFVRFLLRLRHVDARVTVATEDGSD